MIGRGLPQVYICSPLMGAESWMLSFGCNGYSFCRESLERRYDVIVYDGASSEETLRIFGSAERSGTFSPAVGSFVTTCQDVLPSWAVLRLLCLFAPELIVDLNLKKTEILLPVVWVLDPHVSLIFRSGKFCKLDSFRAVGWAQDLLIEIEL